MVFEFHNLSRKVANTATAQNKKHRTRTDRLADGLNVQRLQLLADLAPTILQPALEIRRRKKSPTTKSTDQLHTSLMQHHRHGR